MSPEPLPSSPLSAESSSFGCGSLSPDDLCCLGGQEWPCFVRLDLRVGRDNSLDTLGGFIRNSELNGNPRRSVSEPPDRFLSSTEFAVFDVDVTPSFPLDPSSLSCRECRISPCWPDVFGRRLDHLLLTGSTDWKSIVPPIVKSRRSTSAVAVELAWREDWPAALPSLVLTTQGVARRETVFPASLVPDRPVCDPGDRHWWRRAA